MATILLLLLLLLLLLSRHPYPCASGLRSWRRFGMGGAFPRVAVG